MEIKNFRQSSNISSSSDSDHSLRASAAKKKDKKPRHSKHKKLKKKAHRDFDDNESQVGPSLSGVSDPTTKSAQSKRPMTKEEWEKQQSEVKRVFDPDTGRMRLVKTKLSCSFKNFFKIM